MRALKSIHGALLAASLCCVASVHAGEVIVDFFAAPGTGFADPTPVPAVGGNLGTTLGEQRINVFLHAAAIWTDRLQPEQDVFVAAQFVPLAQNVLGSAGAQFIWSNFPGAELPNTWYFDALADHLTQGDLSPTTHDIVANFSTNFQFYLGFDNNEPASQVDLLPVVLHEMGHGLNFANAVTEATGAIPVPAGATGPFGDIYSQYTVDVTTNKTWNQMTNAERAQSALNARKVSWNGLHVKQAVPQVLKPGEPIVRINKPSSLGLLTVGAAAFGPSLTSAGITGSVVAGLDAADAAGPLTTDGCSPLINPVPGSIVLLDRGTCGFTVKVKNAQDAGAAAVMIADNVVALPPPGLGGVDPTITIPSVRISLADANAIRTALTTTSVNVSLKLDRSILAGTDRVKKLMMVNATNPVQPGSSISHFEPVAMPNQLMEPAINPDLTSSVTPPEDLTLPLLTDLGWFTDRDGVLDGVDHCLGSNIEPTVVLGACNTKAGNDVQTNGCSVSDELDKCAAFAPGKPLKYFACVTKQSGDLVHDHVITWREQLGILACALRQL